MIPASQSGIDSNNVALVRLGDLPQVMQLTVAEPGLGCTSSVVARGHRVPNVCCGGFSLATIEGPFLQTSSFKSAFHTSSNGLCDQISWGSIIDPTLGVSRACHHAMTSPPLLMQHRATGALLLVKLTSTRIIRDIVKGFMFQGP